MKGHMPWISQESPHLFWKIAKKTKEKITPLTVKKSIKKKKSLPFLNITMFSQPKYHIPRWKTVTSSIKPKMYKCYIRKKNKKWRKKRNNENFEEKKPTLSFSCPKDHSTQKLGS